MIREELKDYLGQLEADIKSVDEFYIGEKIGEILNAKKEEVLEKQELAEYIAFNFLPEYPNKEMGWGTYYGPMFILPNKDGQMIEFPSIKRVDDEVLNYWRERADASRHPSLTCRYADLVVDFEPIVKRVNIDYRLAQKVVDSTIEVCSKNLDDGLGCKTKLKRALDIAKQINDSGRLENLKNSIIETEDKFAETAKPGLWGYSFDWLLLENNGKIVLTKEEENNLINGLEEKLKKLMELSDPDPWFVECAVTPLAEYYSKTKNESALKLVLDKFEVAFRANKYANSDGLLVVNYLEKLSEIYTKYSQFQFAKLARERITTELSSLGDRGKFTTHEISVEVPIKKEDIEKFIQSIFGDDSNNLEKVVAKMAVNFVPRKDSVEQQLKDISQKHPLRYLVSNTINSEDGYPIAKFGTLNEDYDKHLLQHFAQNLHFQSLFLRLSFDKLLSKYKPEDLCDVFLLSPVFRKEDGDYILKILNSFWEKDYLTSSCLTIPLIEDAVRNLFKLRGQSFIKRSDDSGGYDVLALRKLLDQGLIKDTFKNIGESVEYYFKVLLTARIGWNLRNNFAHGINKKSFADENIASRLLHVLFCLSLIRKNDKKPELDKASRSKAIFFAFIGPAIEQEEKMFEIQDGFECWNLKKFTFNEFVEEIKKKIPPVNSNVLGNYKIEEDISKMFGITEEQFQQSSWGLMVPETLDEGGFSYAETCFLLNLYSPNFLYSLFYVNDMGIMRQKHNKDQMIYFHTQNSLIFKRKEFVSFYKLLFSQSKYGSWHLDRIKSWTEEDWRLFATALLYSGLKDYENEKNPFGWQRESAEMATIMEALFTAGDIQNEEVGYRLRKRIAVLLSWIFPSIEKDIKDLYKARSAFVHGSFFQQIAKESPKEIPIPDFDLLYKHKEYVRFALVAYLNLAKAVKAGSIKEVKSVIDALERAVIDIKLRQELIDETKKIFSLMPVNIK